MLWELEEAVKVDDIFLAENKFWKRPPLEDIPYSYVNELLTLAPNTNLDYEWIIAGLEIVRKGSMRENTYNLKSTIKEPKRGSKWILKQLENTGIKPIQSCGNGVTRVWFLCEKNHKFKISGYNLVGGYSLSRIPSCPICNPDRYSVYENRKNIRKNLYFSLLKIICPDVTLGVFSEYIQQ